MKQRSSKLTKKLARQHTNLDALLDKSMQKPVVKKSYEDYSATLEAARLIQEMRHGAGLTQTQLASKLGVSQTVIGRIESAKAKRGPTVTMLERIAKACHYRMDLAARPVSEAGQETFHVEVSR